jgi:hypothetical protein
MAWINQQYLKAVTPISGNVDVTEVSSHIDTAQLINTREILGKNLYEDLNTKIKTNSLSPIEDELVEIMKQALAYRSAEIAIPFLGIKIRSKGVVRLNDEFAQAASLEDMKYLRSELSKRADYFETRAKDFLCQFSTDFPLYTQDTNPNNQIYPNYNQPFNSEIYTDNNDYELRRNRYFYGPNGSQPNNKY